ncbi:type VI secretion system baseplate subunit TssF [Photobacterium aphoticum]|uniref:Type VI secretion system protein ImpG n=1 Tax=Photobacterium aphoticum TaxID=754436 RepID=A0A0J1GRH2_9GAMM|nr:type VI secretion system baseplate subunit TssF [Photobacterium aphoticum]KLV02261.1 type VI secretion system protein ImpG [Photobacterium aphoticum]PSU57761.1 type VI secretion system baseplate subunit TssF [Photobacterium aphoticum]GHA55002.1 type VI secretion system protein ImpG [Photobacterium aphoticum]
MSDEILKYYNRELAYIRHMGADFAKRYPKVAGRLRLSDEHVEDPHVSRLIESFALLNAQTRRCLDDSFPELTEALLGQLYPDYHATIPSMSVIKMTTQNINDNGFVLPRGSAVESRVDGFKTCKFSTCYETELWPVEVSQARFENAPFKAPQANFQKSAHSVLKLTLSCEFDNTRLSELGIDRLRFYLNGQAQVSYALYQLLFRSTTGIAIAPKGSTSASQYLQCRHIAPVGFDDEQDVVPYQKRSFSGYRLLVEHFLFPEKFLFFDLVDLDPQWLGEGHEIDVYIYFDESDDFLPKQVTEENVLLGCTPIINLFSQELEPIELKPAMTEYPLIPHYDEAETCEVIQIQQVNASDKFRNQVDIAPFYGLGQGGYLTENDMYWSVRREQSNWAGGHDEPGCESYLSIVDPNARGVDVHESEHWLVTVKAQCSNRNLPVRLPYGGGQPAMSIVRRADQLKEVRCLLAPTQPVRPQLLDKTRWQFAKHLTLNHFSGEQGIDVLKETLKLYDFEQTPQSKALIEAITDMQICPANARVVQQGRVGFCHGSDIVLEFSSIELSGTNLFFFGCVLSHFFSQYTAINSFTRLSVRFRGQSSCFYRWPASAGGQPLL